MSTIAGQAARLIPAPQDRTIRAPRGIDRTCKTWQAEAAMRMLMNNLDLVSRYQISRMSTCQRSLPGHHRRRRHTTVKREYISRIHGIEKYP